MHNRLLHEPVLTDPTSEQVEIRCSSSGVCTDFFDSIRVACQAPRQSRGFRRAVAKDDTGIAADEVSLLGKSTRS